MPRTARLEELGLPFHVIVQGIDRGALFVDDYDRTGFILCALRIFREMGVEVLAWSLMDNHVHFVLRATEGRLSKAMQRLLGSYAQGFNRRRRGAASGGSSATASGTAPSRTTTISWV